MSSDKFEGVKRALAGHYSFERELGQGAYATVFVARDLRHERRVAIKVLHVEPSSELNEIRFLQEIRFLAALQHPNIVPVHDSGHVENLLYYVMPYVRGETVRERIRRERQLPIADAVGISIEVADALDYAHRQRVVHRDIKPENILLSGHHAMLADFGIARAIDSSRSRQITGTGFGSPGTPAYMSPEQILGEHHLDHRTDIYSLGCVLFEMLTGRTPFEGPAAATKRFTEVAPSTCEKRRDVSAALGDAIAQALALSPDDRFSTAARMRDALGAARNVVAVNAASEVKSQSRSAKIHQPSILPRISQSTPPATHAQQSNWWMRRNLFVATGIAFLVVALGGAQAAGLFTRHAPVAAAPDFHRIAVLDFEDQSKDHSLGHIATGLAVSLIRELNGVNGLQVVSRNGVRAFRESRNPIDSVVGALRVGTLVEGGVQQSGDRLRIIVSLVDALSMTQLSSATIDRPMGELFLLEDDVAHEVASLLRRRLGAEVRLREVTSGTTSARARDLVFRADKLRDDATITPYSSDPRNSAESLNELRASDSLLSSAEKADPKWLAPITNRGLVALEIAKRQGGIQQAESFQRAIDLSDKALDRDSANATALEIRGTVLYWQAAKLDLHDAEFAHRLARSESDLKAALSADSTLASAWGTMALVQVAQGRVAEGARSGRTALSMDTYLRDAPTILYGMYAANLMNDDMPAASAWCDRGAHDYPREHSFMECKLTLLAEDESRMPDLRTAFALVSKADSVDPPGNAAAVGRPYTPIYRRMTLAVVLARVGERDSARAVARGAERAARGSSELQLYLKYEEAYLHLVLGERAEAIRLLSEYLAARPTLRGLVSKHPRWRTLRDEAAFRRLVATADGFELGGSIQC